MNKGVFLACTCFYAEKNYVVAVAGKKLPVCCTAGIRILFRFRLLSPMHDYTRPQRDISLTNAHRSLLFSEERAAPTERCREEVTCAHAKQLTKNARFDLAWGDVCCMQDKKTHSDSGVCHGALYYRRCYTQGWAFIAIYKEWIISTIVFVLFCSLSSRKLIFFTLRRTPYMFIWNGISFKKCHPVLPAAVRMRQSRTFFRFCWLIRYFFFFLYEMKWDCHHHFVAARAWARITFGYGQ